MRRADSPSGLSSVRQIYGVEHELAEFHEGVSHFVSHSDGGSRFGVCAVCAVSLDRLRTNGFRWFKLRVNGIGEAAGIVGIVDDVADDGVDAFRVAAAECGRD